MGMDETKEPLITVAGVTAGVTATLGLLVAFGVPITQEQQVAILAVVAVVAPMVVAVIGRRFVTANANVVEYRAVGTDAVIAGQANEIATGSVIRQLGTSTEAQTPQDATGTLSDAEDDMEPEGDAL